MHTKIHTQKKQKRKLKQKWGGGKEYREERGKRKNEKTRGKGKRKRGGGRGKKMTGGGFSGVEERGY